MSTASLNTPGFKIHWVSEKPVFSPDGKFAYVRGTDDLTMPGPNGTPITTASSRSMQSGALSQTGNGAVWSTFQMRSHLRGLNPNT